MEALAEAVGLGRAHFFSSMLDLVDRQVQLERMMKLLDFVLFASWFHFDLPDGIFAPLLILLRR